ncbi:hypothetical protein [Gramella sp. MAR_2010_147]|uniref:hypothetical protein n=1 Tax=Gramella sp. MAR_2010_147 TaxID=1250205 RepID=UPI00087995CB|nr:hypothetical protein [Gramella sp. MAR_2010_147]SDS13471.1 hypothetical protein SAMN04488553_1553 [Gramella sp. MAR_2010_147]
MKNVILILGVFALVSCSAEDDNCRYNKAELDAQYEEWFKQDLTDFERRQMQKEYSAKLEEAC